MRDLAGSTATFIRECEAERAGSATAGHLLMKKPKTKLGGSPDTVGSVLGELVVLEYQLRKTGRQVQEIADVCFSASERIKRLTERLSSGGPADDRQQT